MDLPTNKGANSYRLKLSIRGNICSGKLSKCSRKLSKCSRKLSKCSREA